MRRLFVLALLALSLNGFAQLAISTEIISDTTFKEPAGGTVYGQVYTNDNKPAAFVTVQLKDLKKSTLTGEDGSFTIRNIQPGTYEFEISLVGYQTATKTVTVEKEKTVNIDIQLQLSEKQLAEVIIRTGQNKFAGRNSHYVARLPLPNLENPQVYNTITAELLREQVITSFDDAVKNAPGVNRLWSSTGRAGDGAGYFSMRGFSVQPTMINGIAGLTNGGIDPANIEKIESIKGPSGTLFGSSLISFGGLLNIVTKRPYNRFGGELSYTAGSFGLSRLTADINTPLNKEATALLRVNGSYHYEGSFQDAGFRRSFFIAPSLSHKVTDKLSFLINSEFYNGESTNPFMVFLNRSRQLIARTPNELGIDFSRSFTSNDLTIKTPTVNLYGQANYKISDEWTSQTNFSRSVRKTEGYYSYLMFLDAGGAVNDTLFSRYITNQTASGITTNIQQNFIGDFKLGGLRNRLVVGLDYLNIETNNNNTPYIFDLVSAVRLNDPRYTLFNKQIVDYRLGQSTAANTRNTSLNNTYSIYASDVLNVTEALIAMASIRVDRFESKGTKNHATGITAGAYKQTSVSPKFGLVYQIVKDKVGIFGNYMNGFRNIAPVTQPLPELNGVFEPQQANQLEGGIKVDAFNHKLNFTASYYDLEVTNIIRPATIVQNGVTYNYSIQDGSQRSKGVELDVIANPIAGLNIIAGYSFNDSKLIAADKNVQGRRPTSAGPERLANLWISYTVASGKLQGFGAGFGGNYASDNIITNDLRTGIFTLPSYTVFNASVFYNTKTYRFAIKADNIADKEYFGGWTTVEKQMPRRLAASVAFKF